MWTKIALLRAACARLWFHANMAMEWTAVKSVSNVCNREVIEFILFDDDWIIVVL